MVTVAVEGCCHGALNTIYESLKPDVKLLLICGDFQAIRNTTDLQTLNVPAKYRQPGDFPDYYSGVRKAPVLTIFIGGNHECSSYMRELQYGGWVAPNIYYLGEFGSVWYKGIKITGALGIWNARSFYTKQRLDYLLPYDASSLRLVYHLKPKNLLKLLLSGRSDVCMSHDWPQGIWKFGNERELLRKKKFFKEDMQSGKLGSPGARAALERLEPRYWFSLHLHVKFTATFERNVEVVVKPETTDEIALDMDAESADNDEGISGIDDNMSEEKRKRRKVIKKTLFLALDKCLKGRSFMDTLEIEPDEEHPSAKSGSLHYDARGLAVQMVVERFIKNNSDQWRALDPQVILNLALLRVALIEELEKAVEEETTKLERESPDLVVPNNFEITAPTMNTTPLPPLQYWPNPQTQHLCLEFKLLLPSHEA